MSNQNVLIECHQVSQYFEEAGQRVEVLDAVDLNIYQGQSIAITGASGSGKSSLLYLLGGLEHCKQGSIKLLSKEMAQLSANQLASMRNQYLGFVYQFHHLLMEFTTLENVCMPLLIRGYSFKQASSEAKLFLGKVGLSHRLQHKPSELSGGERQRTAIARALVTKPKCLLADEPTGNLDAHTAQQVLDTLLQINQDLNTSLVVVTHDEKIAGRLACKYELIDKHLQQF